MPLTAGSLDDKGEFRDKDCMARFMDDALPNRPEFGKRERREMLIAISTGVIEYLKAHDSDSFAVTVDPHPRLWHTAHLVIS